MYVSQYMCACMAPDFVSQVLSCWDFYIYIEIDSIHLWFLVLIIYSHMYILLMHMYIRWNQDASDGDLKALPASGFGEVRDKQSHKERLGKTQTPRVRQTETHKPLDRSNCILSEQTLQWWIVFSPLGITASAHMRENCLGGLGRPRRRWTHFRPRPATRLPCQPPAGAIPARATLQVHLQQMRKQSATRLQLVWVPHMWLWPVPHLRPWPVGRSDRRLIRRQWPCVIV